MMDWRERAAGQFRICTIRRDTCRCAAPDAPSTPGQPRTETRASDFPLVDENRSERSDGREGRVDIREMWVRRREGCATSGNDALAAARRLASTTALPKDSGYIGRPPVDAGRPPCPAAAMATDPRSGRARFESGGRTPGGSLPRDAPHPPRGGGERARLRGRKNRWLLAPLHRARGRRRRCDRVAPAGRLRPDDVP